MPSGSAAQRQRERTIFEGFLAAMPAFKARICGAWTQPEDDPPDVRFRDADSREVGVELKAWINQEQMAQAKRREALEARFLEAVAGLPNAVSERVSYVWLHWANDVWSRPVQDQAPQGDVSAFREELLFLVAKTDATWATRAGPIVQAEKVTHLDNHPTLARYLAAVSLFPPILTCPRGDRWIGFPLEGGFYDETDMMAPLDDLIAAARQKYEVTKLQKGLDRLVLLIHYDSRALRYNSPIDTPDWDFGVFATGMVYMTFALDTLSEQPSPWDEVFLFDAVNKRTVQVCPR